MIAFPRDGDQAGSSHRRRFVVTGVPRSLLPVLSDISHNVRAIIEGVIMSVHEDRGLILETQPVGPFWMNTYVIGCARTREAIIIDPG